MTKYLETAKEWGLINTTTGEFFNGTNFSGGVETAKTFSKYPKHAELFWNNCKVVEVEFEV